MSNKRKYNPGEICPLSGLYRLVHHAHEDISAEQAAIPLTKGERFPPCRNCKEQIAWELVEEAKLD